MVRSVSFIFKKLLAGLAVLGCVAGLMVTALPQASSAADPVVLTVTGDGVEKTVTFTQAQLEALPQATYTYSGYNHWPSLNFFRDAAGPTLKTILDKAGLKPGATLIRVKDPGAPFTDYTVDQLLNDPRYYFPDVQNAADCVGWPPDRSEEGKVPVETMIAMNYSDGKLLFGQRSPTEPTVCHGLNYDNMFTGGIIEVTTAQPEQWEAPNVDINPGTVVPGTKVKLQYLDGTNTRPSVYYTLDGSDPTYGSNIANISYPYFNPQLNAPVTIDGDLTIKTRTIGFGKLDSEVATYQYKIGNPACTVEGAGSTPVSYSVDSLKAMQPAEESYQCSVDGKTVSLKGKGVLLGTLLDQLNVSGRCEVKFVAANGEEYDGGTVQELKNQQCMLAYEVEGQEIADVSGDKTVYIQILRNLGDSDVTGNRLRYVNTVKLVNVDDELTVESVRLLDCAGQAVTSVAPGGGYCIEAQVVNYVNAAKDALLIIQVRSGEGAAAASGGSVVGCAAVQKTVDVTGDKVTAEFTMPAGLSGEAYVDVLVWDNCDNRYPLGKDNHDLSFNIE